MMKEKMCKLYCKLLFYFYFLCCAHIGSAIGLRKLGIGDTNLNQIQDFLCKYETIKILCTLFIYVWLPIYVVLLTKAKHQKQASVDFQTRSRWL